MTLQREVLPCDLFDFAYIPAWFEQLFELSKLAAPEPWRYAKFEQDMNNTETPILERYINQVFRLQAVEWNETELHLADHVMYIRNEFSCFHTGLYTTDYQGIYMCFERNKKPDAIKKWFFKGFIPGGSEKLRYVQTLPKRPFFNFRQQMLYYEPDWEIRLNTEHILCDEQNAKRLPECLRDAWNLPLMLETAVELARRRARVDWSLAVPQVFQGKVQYLLPLYLTRMDQPDLALALSIMDGYYIGHTALTLPMAYQNARILGRPSVDWLASLVQTNKEKVG